jgi:GMP synthase-like glutamine amidotransferase
MRIHCLQHETFELPAYIGTWAKQKDYLITYTLLYEKYHHFPPIEDFDFLLIMGGSMSTYEEDKYPFLRDEKAFISRCIASDKKILGICLGSQLLASAFGAKVYPNKEKEIGWLPIQLTLQGRDSPFFAPIPDIDVVFHWHGDTFDLPEGATHLAYSEGCKNQAFSVGNSILALQFHLEAEEESVTSMVSHGADELVTGRKYIQNKEEILLGKVNIPNNNKVMKHILETFDQL